MSAGPAVLELISTCGMLFPFFFQSFKVFSVRILHRKSVRRSLRVRGKSMNAEKGRLCVGMLLVTSTLFRSLR